MAEKKKKEKKEKPLEKWTIKELRETALEIPNIQGVHGMNKNELIEIVREHKGLPAPEKKKTVDLRELKKKVIDLKQVRDAKREEGASRSELNIMRRKISRLKKQTRR
jgi:hypothetical protein